MRLLDQPWISGPLLIPSNFRAASFLFCYDWRAQHQRNACIPISSMDPRSTGSRCAQDWNFDWSRMYMTCTLHIVQNMFWQFRLTGNALLSRDHRSDGTRGAFQGSLAVNASPNISAPLLLLNILQKIFSQENSIRTIDLCTSRPSSDVEHAKSHGKRQTLRGVWRRPHQRQFEAISRCWVVSCSAPRTCSYIRNVGLSFDEGWWNRSCCLTSFLWFW